MTETDDCCTDLIPFPKDADNFSLTNWTEIVIFNNLSNSSIERNQFYMFKHPYKMKLWKVVRKVANVDPNLYIPYRVISIDHSIPDIKLKRVDYDFNGPARFHKYFIISISELGSHVGNEQKIAQILYQAYHIRQGIQAVNQISSKQFKVSQMRFPPQMASRERIFR